MTNLPAKMENNVVEFLDKLSVAVGKYKEEAFNINMFDICMTIPMLPHF